MKETLTQEQQARIYCIKQGHANYGYMFWGYVHCGRCGEQIGDKLGGIFPQAEHFLFISCKDKPCKFCDKIKKKLSPLDKEILKRLKKADKKGIINHGKVLEGIDFKELKKD